MEIKTVHLNPLYPFLKQSGCDPTATVYLQHNSPEVADGKTVRPCLVICPGGGYEFLSQREGEPIGLPFFPDGYDMVVLNYSLAPHCTYPQQLLEVAACVDLIHQNAAAWQIDPDRLVLMGFSAGAHLAATYANRWNADIVREKLDAKPVKACVLGYPVITGGEYTHLGSLQNLSGEQEPTAETRALFSMELAVGKQTPPTFLWHTAEDSCVPVENSLLYARALSANKIPFALHIYPFGGHGLATCDAQTGSAGDVEAKSWFDLCREWLRRTI